MQWPMRDWGSVLGEGFGDDTKRRSLSWCHALVSSAFHSWPNFGEKPSCN